MATVDRGLDALPAIPLSPPRDPLPDVGEGGPAAWLGRVVRDDGVFVTVRLHDSATLAVTSRDIQIRIQRRGRHSECCEVVPFVRARKRVDEAAAVALARCVDARGVDAVLRLEVREQVGREEQVVGALGVGRALPAQPEAARVNDQVVVGVVEVLGVPVLVEGGVGGAVEVENQGVPRATGE